MSRVKWTPAMEKELATATKMMPRKHARTPWKCLTENYFPKMTTDQVRRKAKHLGLSAGSDKPSKKRKPVTAGDSESDHGDPDSEDEEREEMMELLAKMPSPHCTQTKWHWAALFNKRKRSAITVLAKPRVRMMKVTSGSISFVLNQTLSHIAMLNQVTEMLRPPGSEEQHEGLAPPEWNKDTEVKHGKRGKIAAREKRDFGRCMLSKSNLKNAANNQVHQCAFELPEGVTTRNFKMKKNDHHFAVWFRKNIEREEQQCMDSDDSCDEEEAENDL